MSNTGKFVLGLFGAAAAGVIAGLLIAPEKGSETRKNMIEGIGKIAIDLANMLQYGKDQLHQAEQTLSEESTELKNDVKRRAERVEESFS